MKEALQAYINSLSKTCPNLNSEELDFIQEKVTITRLDAKAYFLKAREVQEQMGYVFEGLLRSYYINEEGKEITISFIPENTYAADYSAFITQKPSKFYIQALEPCVFVNLSYSAMQECYLKYKNFEMYGRLIAENILVMRQNRIETFLFDNAEQRYLDYIKHNPTLLNRISLTHLSSFLGIERQSLTRIRKKLIKKSF